MSEEPQIQAIYRALVEDESRTRLICADVQKALVEGACCLGSFGACVEITESSCERSGGTWQGEGIHPLQVMGAVGETFGRDAIYTVDGGNTALWASLTLAFTSALFQNCTGSISILS